MKEYSLIMGLTDYISVILFAVSGGIFIKMLYQKSTLWQFVLLTGGFLFAGFAGFCKATYKTLYGGGICDFQILNNVHMFLLSIGICMAGYAFIGITSRKNHRLNIYSVSPVVVTSNMPFIIMNVIGVIAMFAGIVRLAKKLKAKPAVFFVSGFFIVEMTAGFMGSRTDFDKSAVNWMGQGLQTLANFMLLMSAIDLNKKMKVADISMAFWNQYK